MYVVEWTIYTFLYISMPCSKHGKPLYKEQFDQWAAEATWLPTWLQVAKLVEFSLVPTTLEGPNMGKIT